MTPTRLVDTRSAGGWARLAPDRFRVPVAGRAHVPPSAAAVAVAVTTFGGSTPARTSVGPSGSPAPADTSLTGAWPTDLDVAGAQTQMYFVKLGHGALDVVHTTPPCAVAIDVIGYFEPVTSASEGRMITTAPTRVLDTGAAANPFGPWEVREISTGVAFPGDAIAVLVNLTASSITGRGHWTAFASGTPPPTWTVAISTSGEHSAFAVVPLSGRTLRILSSAGGHVAVDVVGYVTGPDASTSTEGLFVPEAPYCALDTRLVDQRIPIGSSREFTVGPSSCSAVAMAVSTVSANDAGQTAVWGAGDLQPTDSTLRHRDDGAAASTFTVARAGRRGAAVGVTGGAAHAVVDVYGWFTGERSLDRHPVTGAQPYGIQGIEMESFADEWFDYGVSTDGRPLRAFRRGSGPRHALVTTGLHGDEHTGTSVLADLVTRPAIPGWTVWMVPIANPDARAENARFVHDVDMNRDFPVDWSSLPSPTASGCVTTRTGPSPFSLVESQQLSAAMSTGPFRRATVSISHHDNYNWVAPQSGSPPALRELADHYANTTGLRRPGLGGSVVPTSPRSTGVKGGFETFAHSLGMSSILVENKAGYSGDGTCAGAFGLDPTPADVAPHHDALYDLLTDARLP